MLNAAEQVAAAVQHEGWHTQRGEDGTDVAARQVPPVPRGALWRVRQALATSPPLAKTRIRERAGREDIEGAAASVALDVARCAMVKRVRGHAGRIVGVA